MGFFQVIVGDFFGSKLMAFFGLMALYTFIALIGRLSMMLTLSMLLLYVIVFSTGFFGSFLFVIFFIASAFYFFVNLIRWFSQ